MVRQMLTVHDGGLGSQLVGLSLGYARVQDGAMSVDNGLGEAGRPGSEEENSLEVGLGRSELKVLGATLDLDGLLDIIEQLDVQASNTSLVELTGSNLVGQPDGFDTV